MDTNLIINYTNGNKKGSKAISNINPEKDNQTLKTFAQMVNGLTTNTYVDATRINKQSVEEADAGGSSTPADITLTVTPSDKPPPDYTYETIEGGVRLNFGNDGYIDVTY